MGPTAADLELQAQKLSEDLEGTCATEPEELHGEHGDDIRAMLTVFCCSTCGWWCSEDEASENELDEECEECYRDSHPEEDEDG